MMIMQQADVLLFATPDLLLQFISPLTQTQQTNTHDTWLSDYRFES